MTIISDLRRAIERERNAPHSLGAIVVRLGTSATMALPAAYGVERDPVSLAPVEMPRVFEGVPLEYTSDFHGFQLVRRPYQPAVEA